MSASAIERLARWAAGLWATEDPAIRLGRNVTLMPRVVRSVAPAHIAEMYISAVYAVTMGS